MNAKMSVVISDPEMDMDRTVARQAQCKLSEVFRAAQRWFAPRGVASGLIETPQRSVAEKNGATAALKALTCRLLRGGAIPLVSPLSEQEGVQLTSFQRVSRMLKKCHRYRLDCRPVLRY
jgi:hypothetical protein